MLSRFRTQKGFTLIELMIVVAIIGILAAIAIPNYIAFRNKSFCSRAESDANSIASRIADYFAIPTHTRIVTADISHSTQNTWAIAAADPSVHITVSVTDSSGRCPVDYQLATPSTTSRDGWSGAVGGRYLKHFDI